MSRGHNTLQNFSAIQEARLQMFLDFAEDQYLTRLASNLGIDRPLGHSDDLFRALTKQAALTRHSTLKIFTDVLDILLGPAKSRVFELSEDLPAGSIKAKLVSTRGMPQVGVLRIDPETSYEETLRYNYVDYLNNEIWFTDIPTIDHVSKQPKTTINQNIIVGDNIFTVAEDDLFPEGAFIGVLDRGGDNEEYVYIASRSGNSMTTLADFALTASRDIQPTGELQNTSHRAGETFEWITSINPPGKLTASLSSGDTTMSVESADSSFSVEKIFPQQDFQVILAPGTPREETVRIAANDRLSPSTFTVVGASSTLAAYLDGTSLDVQGGDAALFTAIVETGTVADSTFEAVLDAGTPNEERVLLQFSAGDSFDILGYPGTTETFATAQNTHGIGSTLHLTLAVANDHPIGTAVVFSFPGNAVLNAPIAANTEITTNTWQIPLTRVDRFAEAKITTADPFPTFDQYSVIINQGEVNEDIVGIGPNPDDPSQICFVPIVGPFGAAADKGDDVLQILQNNETALANDHDINEPVRPATIVLDGAGWAIRELEHKVSIYVPDEILLPTTLRDASYLHYDGLLGYADIDFPIAEGDTFIPISDPTDPDDFVARFPEVGLLLISDGTSSSDEYVKYISRRTTILTKDTIPLGVVGAFANDDDDTPTTTTRIKMFVDGFSEDPTLVPNPADGTYQIEVNGALFTVTARNPVGTTTSDYNVVLDVTADTPTIVSLGETVEVRGIRIANGEDFSSGDTVFIGTTSSGTVTGFLPTGKWLLLSAVPPAGEVFGSIVYPNQLGFTTSNQERFSGDTGLSERTSDTSVLYAGNRYVGLINNVGTAVAADVLLTGAIVRGDTAFTVENDFGTFHDLGTPVLIGAGDASAVSNTDITQTGGLFSDLAGKILRIVDGPRAGTLRVISSSAGDTISFTNAIGVAADLDGAAFEVYDAPLLNVILGSSPTQEIRTVIGLELEDGAGDYTATIHGKAVYPHPIGDSVQLATRLDGEVARLDTNNYLTSYVGAYQYDEVRREAQQLSTTALSTALPTTGQLAADVVSGTASFDVFDGSNLPAAGRFNVILGDNTLSEETVEVTKTATGVVTDFPDSATLTITDGDLLTYSHSQFDTAVYPITSIEVDDSSTLAGTEGTVILNFGYLTEEIVRYSSNDASTGTLTLERPTVFEHDHAVGETVDLTSLFSVPDDQGDAYPFYLPPDPYARLRFWTNLAKAAGICIDFSGSK